jgi:hypothetical protein
MPIRRSYIFSMRWMVIYEYEVPGGDLNLSSTKLPRPWPPWESSPSRKNPHGRTGDFLLNIRPSLLSQVITYSLFLYSGPVPSPEVITVCTEWVLHDCLPPAPCLRPVRCLVSYRVLLRSLLCLVAFVDCMEGTSHFFSLMVFVC